MVRPIGGRSLQDKGAVPKERTVLPLLREILFFYNQCILRCLGRER